jgi:hypothetical protein
MLTDLLWLLGIGLIMANSNIWVWLSPRPEIGKVAVLWLPNAVLVAALLRNWGRIWFCLAAIFVFYIVPFYPSFLNNSLLSSAVYLSIDVVEVLVLVSGLLVWGGSNFRLTTGLSVAAFAVVACMACVIGAFGASAASQLSIGNTPIAQDAPLQVGVTWFMSDLATYFFLAAPLIAVTGRDWREIWSDLGQNWLICVMGGLGVALLTIVGHALPQWLSAKTGIAPGPGGLLLIAFPLAAFLATTRGPAIAALAGAAIAIPSIYATVAGIGPFGKGKIAADVFDMQATLVVSMLTLLLIAGMAEQLRDRSRALERALDEAMKRRHGNLETD